jgi:large subunit ribosomal protein L32e
MADEIRRLIRVRAQKGAVFKRDGFGKKSQISDSWRKPRGQHSKQRRQKKARGALPRPGFCSPVAVRGMHPSGFYDILVFSVDELGELNPKTQAVRIAANVGRRIRAIIQEKALSAGLKVLNAREVPQVKTTPPEPVKTKEEKKEKEQRQKRTEKPKKTQKEMPKKKEETKVKAEKKKPAKPEPKKKAKTESSKKETPKKETKQKVQKEKATAQAEQKKKRGSDKKAEPAKGPKAGKKTASKPVTRSRKKTGTEVKGNE